MAILKPFKAWRPAPEKAIDIVSVPYDIVNTDEARELAEGKPNSFLHVIRPEIDLPEETDIYSDEVYVKGKENLSHLLQSELYQQEETESIYIYKLSWKDTNQFGIFGCVSVDDYDNEIILKHELTRPDKEDDRTKHLITQQAHPEPVMMAFEDSENISELINQITQEKTPLYELTLADVEHTLWKVDDHSELVNRFSNLSHLYIADGHHRCASASRAASVMKSSNPDHTGNEEYNYFPAVLFPFQQMNILPYNRVVYSVPDDFLSGLTQNFDVENTLNPVPGKKGTICMYYSGDWYSLELPESNKNDASASLDVARLSEFILEPYLDITDQRTDKNISFVGGIRGTQELEKLVDSGKADLAISMVATSAEELKAVSDAGLLMPPKSTWFEPKLRSGFLVHTF